MALKDESYYIRKKLEKLGEEEKTNEIKHLLEAELLGDVRKWGLGAYRDKKEGRTYEPFPEDFLERATFGELFND